jgi:hypothetical protein
MLTELSIRAQINPMLLYYLYEIMMEEKQRQKQKQTKKGKKTFLLFRCDNDTTFVFKASCKFSERYINNHF